MSVPKAVENVGNTGSAYVKFEWGIEAKKSCLSK